jgi:hypothetical protein
MEQLRLDEYVRSTYASTLSEIGAKHVEYILDEKHFGNELDTYSNSRMRIDFIRDRGDESVRLSPVNHREDVFDLLYFAEMLAADETASYGFKGFGRLPQVVQRMYHIFDSPNYSCFRRAYLTYENCRNLLDITNLKA